MKDDGLLTEEAGAPEMSADPVELSLSSSSKSDSVVRVDPTGPSTIFPPGIGPAPSQTSVFIRCPRLWALSGVLTPRESWTPHMLAGQALHRALEILLRPSSTVAEALDSGVSMLRLGWRPTGEWTLEGVEEHVKRGIRRLSKGLGEFIPEGSEILGTEQCLDHTTHTPEAPAIPGLCAIADLIIREPDGGVTIVDLKTKLSSEMRWVERDLRFLPADHQLWDYSYRYTQRPPWEMPARFRKVFLVCSPRAFILAGEVEVTEAGLRQWETSTSEWWDEMDEGKPIAYSRMNHHSCSAFGGCPMQFHCLHLGGQGTLDQLSNFYEVTKPEVLASYR